MSTNNALNRASGWLITIAILSAPMLCRAQAYTITSVAGGGQPSLSGVGDGGQATSAFVQPSGVAVDASGNLFIAESASHVIRKVAPDGIISTIAGSPSRSSGYSGDGGPATKALLNSPWGLAVDAANNLYIADTANNRIRKVDSNGVITTVAGGGSPASNGAGGLGDGGLATSAVLNMPEGIAVDAAGNLYIADFGTSRVRKVNLSGIITTVAGGGGAVGSIGDLGLATNAYIGPYGVAVDGSGNLYIADWYNNRIRKVAIDGTINTVVGSGNGLGDGGPATLAGLMQPESVAVDTAGNLFIADTGEQRIRMVTRDGIVATIAGTGGVGGSGDGGPATSARLDTPTSLAIGSGGLIYVADNGQSDQRVRRLTPAVPPSGAPSITTGGVVSASAFGQFAAIAPGSWIEIYGFNLATKTRSWTGDDFTGVIAPTSLEGTKVSIGGQLAFLDYISPGQVVAQAPSNVATGSQPLVVSTALGASAPYIITVNATQPGLLAPSSFNIGGKQYAAATFSDGGYVLPPGAIFGVSSRRAQPGDNITLYGVGFGPVTPNIPAGQVVQQSNALALPFHLFVGQTETMLPYAGLAPNVVGLYQFNAVVPAVPGGDTVPLSFTLGGAPGTQTLYLPVQSDIAPQLQSLTLSGNQIAGGGTIQGTVVLTGAAPAGGALVALSSSSSAAAVAPAVTVAAGATSASFAISTSKVSVNQTATISATYAGKSVQATLTVAPPAVAPFLSVVASVLFQPSGSPSGQVIITLTPDAGNETYTANLGNAAFIKGTAANGTFTFSSLQPSTVFPPYGLFSSPGNNILSVTGGSLSLTLSQTAAIPGLAAGTVSGTLSITGTSVAGGVAVTLSGPILGNYNATLAP